MKNKKKQTISLRTFSETISSDARYYNDNILHDIIHNIPVKFYKTRKKVLYINIPAAFDIEVSSFYNNGEKAATMYIWQFGIYGYTIYGRTWEEFIQCCENLSELLELDEDKRIVIYVHNLSYEFQFIRKLFEWSKIFAADERKPIYAATISGIEFRCSYILSGMSLEKMGQSLIKYKCEKMTGDLDYNLIRHSETPLSEKELGYAINDIRVVMCYIMEKIETDGNITKIPLTKTSYARKFCRKNCTTDSENRKNNGRKYCRYRDLMQSLTLTTKEYKMLKGAFQGGFTHANAYFVEKTMNNIGSFDLTSSYPTVMVAERFPMSKGERVYPLNAENIKISLDKYCCLIAVKFENIEPLCDYDNPLSYSKCKIKGKYDVNNGRVVSAEELYTVCTDVDLQVYKRFYKWDNMKICNIIRYKRGYLPRDYILSVLQIYVDKTTLKGVAGSEYDYALKKELLNSLYGMTVTDIVREENTYDNEDGWGITPPDEEKQIEHYNNSKSRFLSYAWGVWVTAYARRNLFSAIYSIGDDYIYSDTDSVKIRNTESHRAYFEHYNKEITRKLTESVKFNKIPVEMICPKNKNGEPKPLGVWDFEGIYTRFKTLGAKRYLFEKDGKYILTVAGLNKSKAIDYMLAKYGGDVFRAFDDDLYIPPEHTGKLTHTYIDGELHGIITDYTGITANYSELSAVHLEPAEYSLSLAEQFINYLKGIKDVKT